MTIRPNVMFIIADQHNAKCLGCASHPQVRTPNLDTMAAKGVRFTRAITTSPICTPSRLSYLTGQYCHNHGHYGNGGNAPHKLPSLLAHLRRSDYRTASIGSINEPYRWQQKDSDWFRDAYPIDSAPYPWQEGYIRSAYDEYLDELGLLRDRDDYYYIEGTNRYPEGLDGRPSRLPYEHSVEAWCVKEARAFVESCGARPWFAYLALPRPHSNYCPAQEFWDLYDNDALWFPPSADYDLSAKAPHLRQSAERFRKGQWAVFEPRHFEAARRRKQIGYLGAISQVDHAVGSMIDYLERKGVLENTITIYTADHGEYATAHGLMEKAPGICGDDVCRVPSIWRWDGQFAADHTSEAIIQNVDLAPTLCSLLNMPEMRTVDGEDISRLLRGEDAVVRDFGVTEHPWSRAIVKGDWRLVYYPKQMFADELNGEVFGELYHLTEDPWEMNNLYLDPTYSDKVRELERDLMDWLVTTTSAKTVLPWVAPRDENGSLWKQRVEADGKLHWRDVAAQMKRTKHYL